MQAVIRSVTVPATVAMAMVATPTGVTETDVDRDVEAVWVAEFARTKPRVAARRPPLTFHVHPVPKQNPLRF